MVAPKPLSEQEIEQMRLWIRKYYVRAGHEESAHLADAICDLALSAKRNEADADMPAYFGREGKDYAEWVPRYIYQELWDYAKRLKGSQ